MKKEDLDGLRPAGSPLVWGLEKPAVEGWYFYRHEGFSQEDVQWIEVVESRAKWLDETSQSFVDVPKGYEWAGPISQPAQRGYAAINWEDKHNRVLRELRAVWKVVREGVPAALPTLNDRIREVMREEDLTLDYATKPSIPLTREEGQALTQTRFEGQNPTHICAEIGIYGKCGLPAGHDGDHALVWKGAEPSGEARPSSLDPMLCNYCGKPMSYEPNARFPIPMCKTCIIGPVSATRGSQE